MDYNSPLYEFIQNSANKIIESDARYINLNREILKLEKELLPLLGQEALSKYIKIDKIATELSEHVRSILYRKYYDNYDKKPIKIEGQITTI